jgi:hypothetical protein
MKKRIYLDDVRTPVDQDWVVVRSYDEFIAAVKDIGLSNIDVISLDHDLGDSAMQEYHNNVSPNYTLDYSNITEKTGLDCAKWLIEHWFELNASEDYEIRQMRFTKTIDFPEVYVHSANPIGSANIMGYVNNFYMNARQPQTCVRVKIEHTI